MFLNNPWVKEKVKKLKHIFNRKQMKTKYIKICGNSIEEVLKGTICLYYKKEKHSQIKDLTPLRIEKNKSK